MFTGIIQALGNVASIEPRGGDVRLRINTGKLDLSAAQLGDSIAVNGCCLTAVELSDSSFAADVSNESLALTTLGSLKTGSSVNLETALTLKTPLGGHLVSGHVDGLAELVERHDDARSVRFTFAAPANLARYIAHKGSVCIDGTSLTVNSVDGCRFDLNVIPHTLQETIIGEYQVGRKVNLEVDLIARYLERLLLGERAAEAGSSANNNSDKDAHSAVTAELLQRTGFIK